VEHACPAARYAVITDSHVAPLYAERVRASLATSADAELFTFPAGEWNKSRESWGHLTDQLLQRQFDRESAIVAVGGGVTGDLVGFIAATYRRGIRYLYVPTSLLAMVDCAVGAQTGVDTQFGRNLVGAFHPPRAVVTDLEALSTLPPVQLAAGMAAAIKHAVIADGGYFEHLLARRDAIRERDAGTVADLVRRSVEIKSSCTAALRFGQTLAGALQDLTKYELLYGEALGIGMLLEAELGEACGITNPGVAARIGAALDAFRLPIEPPQSLDTDRMIDAMRRDAAAQHGTVRFALPKALGAMAAGELGEPTIAVPESAVREVLSRFS
jgi:3-dehydroquinate synthase